MLQQYDAAGSRCHMQTNRKSLYLVCIHAIQRSAEECTYALLQTGRCLRRDVAIQDTFVQLDLSTCRSTKKIVCGLACMTRLYASIDMSSLVVGNNSKAASYLGSRQSDGPCREHTTSRVGRERERAPIPVYRCTSHSVRKPSQCARQVSMVPFDHLMFR
jgi:hypothetical protein